MYHDIPLYVLQCCANDAHNLTLLETQQLFEQKYLPLKVDEPVGGLLGGFFGGGSLFLKEGSS